MVLDDIVVGAFEFVVDRIIDRLGSDDGQDEADAPGARESDDGRS